MNYFQVNQKKKEEFGRAHLTVIEVALSAQTGSGLSLRGKGDGRVSRRDEDKKKITSKRWPCGKNME